MVDWATYFERVSERQKGFRATLNRSAGSRVSEADPFGDDALPSPFEAHTSIRPSWGLLAGAALVGIWVGTEIGIRALKRTEIDLIR